jgi:G:T/U-mismatch repair DNA glycosylase
VTPDELDELTRRPGPGDHRVTLTIDGAPTETLADLPPLRDHLLFVGAGPTPESVAAGHYHRGRLGRTFWRRLMLATVLPRATAVDTADDALVAAGHGITDLVKRPAAGDGPEDGELRRGVGPLWQKVALWRPAAVVFLEKRVATACAGRALAEPWGQLEGIALGGRPCFLMPAAFAPTEEVDEGLNFLRNLSASLPRDRA